MFWDDVRVKVQPVIFNDVVSFQAKLSLLSFFFVNDSLSSEPVVAAATHRNSMDVPSDIILDSLEDAIIGLDDQSNVVLLNEAAGHILGCPRMEAIGQPSSRFPALAAVIRQLRLDEPAASGQPGRTCHRLEIHKPETGPVPMEATVSSLLFNGKKFCTIVICDISRQQQIERALYDSRKTQALGALASGIAHDFNNVLAAVISQIDLVLHTPEFPGTLKDHLVYAQTSARRGAELVGKLQLFSRQSKPALAPLDPAEAIDQVVFMLRRSLDPKIAIQFSKPLHKPWLITADSAQLMQALLNLGLNARDAMPDGGTITIEMENISFAADITHATRKPGEFVRLTVADTGRGMTPEVLARVFEPYFTTKDTSRGPGLGLSITAAVVAEHSGWMEADSQLGQGARFSILIPRSNEPETTPRQVPVPDTKATEGKERILLADDEELVRMVTKAVLSYRGYQIIEAADGQEAVEKYSAASGTIDLVLMDMHMPRLNGYDALVRIREINPKARAIMFSGGVHDPEDGIGHMEKVAFLHKPFENQELLRIVRQSLDTN